VVLDVVGQPQYIVKEEGSNVVLNLQKPNTGRPSGTVAAINLMLNMSVKPTMTKYI